MKTYDLYFLCALISISILATGCNSYNAKDQAVLSQPIENKASPDFTRIQAQILKTNCVSCHSDAGGNAAGINLESYANVKKNIEDIQQSVVIEKSMPPGKPISPESQQLLINWIANGAPENTSSSSPAPGVTSEPNAPPPQSKELLPTYSSILKNILTAKCVACHDSVVTNYDTLMASKWVVANDLVNSPLYVWVKNGKMPRRQKLSQDEIDVIGGWISDGAKNN